MFLDCQNEAMNEGVFERSKGLAKEKERVV
jgi:hypothetical protein